MFQVLIVDDHPHLVDSMAKTLPWSDLRVEHVHKAYSAFDAMEILGSAPVDLVITDIRMPVMSGLELIKEIRDRWKTTKIILLSGYADFEYAKEALKQDVEDYLLKPVPDEDLIVSIRGVLEKKEIEWKEIISTQRAMSALNQHLPVLKQNLLMDLLQRRPIPDAALRDKLDLYNIPFPVRSPAAMALIRLEDSFAASDEQSVTLYEYAIGNIAAEIFHDDFVLWHCRDDYGYLVLLIACKEELYAPAADEAKRQQRLEQCAVSLQHYVQAYLKGSISALVSDWFDFPREAPYYYQNCLYAFRQRIGNDRAFFMTLKGAESSQKISFFSSLYEPPTLKQLIEAGQWKELHAKLERIFDELVRDWSESEEHILEAYLEICGMLTYIAHKNRKRLVELIGPEYEKVVGGLSFKTVKQLREWTFRILEMLSGIVDRERQHSHASIVKQVNEYVENNLSDDVSIQTVAQKVFLHPSYLSRIYKSESGESYSDYVLRIRMEKAVVLLKNKGIKVYDISAGLGYNQTQHFIKMFKKFFGLTPQEYRERML
ncbi:response regulator [Cohnella sp. GCM10027633]|uniref:response regulator transcription factor n=1 Tax=unclassified Cohnella TaxID=2636738 RepID=UPI00362CD4F2